MSAKKMTTRKRAEMKSKKAKATKGNYNLRMIFSVLIIIIIVAIAGIYFITADNTDKDQDENGDPNNGSATDNPIAVIATSMGTIRVELFQEKVPNTVDNFIKLANDGFYEGLVFHRVANINPNEPDTNIIQGGGYDTDANQKQSPYGTIDLEINEEVRHNDGAIAMARLPDPNINSATSQFYICDGSHSFLDDGYAAFGFTIQGMDVVRAIAAVETDTKKAPDGRSMQNWPVNDVIINSITIENQ